jgi:lysozyme
LALRFAVIDGCPCPKPLYPILRKIQHDVGIDPLYNSIYRGDDVAAILHRFGKHTQRELWEELPPGVANPPDRGTHILLGDGVVGVLHRKLHWYQCGIDVNDAYVGAVIAAAAKHGWKLYRPYPSGSEFHHLNFARKPTRWRAFYRHVFGGAHDKAVEKRVKKHHHQKHQPVPKTPTKLSDRGAKFIGSFEGFLVDAYWDQWGSVWTIGFGHTGNVHPGDHVTRRKALTLLERDAATAARAVRDLVDVPLNQNQFDALVSFAFNLGAGALAESTLLRKLNKGNYRGASREFKKWVHAGGQVLPGLVRRRHAEAHLFLTPVRANKG